ncbi:MAG: DUF2141 domain-containing protein [Pacificimonas sp.]
MTITQSISTIVLASFAMVTLPAAAATLTVDVENVRQADGKLYVSLQTADQFMKNDGTYGTIVEAPAAGTVSVPVSGVAPGTYSISVWHDDDGNGEFDMGERGPLDGWAMLNGETMRAAPTFEATSLVIGESDQSAAVTMIYGRK